MSLELELGLDTFGDVTLGRGSFTESFPLFGYRLDDYQVLFEEKLELFAALLEEKPVTWSGTTRAPLQDQRVYPPTESGSLRTWIGVGGSPESVVRAAKYGLPLVLAIIGGEPLRFSAARPAVPPGAGAAGTLPHLNIMRCIELYGTEVVPLGREMLSRR